MSSPAEDQDQTQRPIPNEEMRLARMKAEKVQVLAERILEENPGSISHDTATEQAQLLATAGVEMLARVMDTIRDNVEQGRFGTAAVGMAWLMTQVPQAAHALTSMAEIVNQCRFVTVRGQLLTAPRLEDMRRFNDLIGEKAFAVDSVTGLPL